MSTKANLWRLRHALKIVFAWTLIITGIPNAIANGGVIAMATISEATAPGLIWVFFILSVILPVCGILMLRQPTYYPDYVGGVMGYKNRDAYEKAKLEQSQKRKAAGRQF